MSAAELEAAIAQRARDIAKKSSSVDVDRWAGEIVALAAQILSVAPVVVERRRPNHERRQRDMPGQGRRIAQRRGGVKTEAATPQLIGLTITSSAPLTFEPTDTHQLEWTYIFSPSAELVGSADDPTFTSSNESVVTVDSAGLVTAEAGGGSATVTLTAPNGITAVASFTVTTPLPALDEVIVTPSTLDGIVGGTGQVAARTEDASNNLLPGLDVDWESSNEAVATVGADSGDDNHQATVSFVGAGSCTITGTSGAESDTCAVTVTAGGAETVYASHDFEDGGYGAFTAEGSNHSISIVGVDNGVTPYSGTKMVKLASTTGNGSGYAQLRRSLTNNPARSALGIYCRYYICVPAATITNALATTHGTDAQIKLNLYRVGDQIPANHTPPAYHGIVVACGRANTSQNDLSVAKDHLNIWLNAAANAINGSGTWNKNPKYTGGTWLKVQLWYQTTDGLATQYKLWLNDLLCKHETFNNPTGGNNKLIGGATTDTYQFRVGMPYFVNRSGVAGGLVVYIDKVKISDTYITD